MPPAFISSTATSARASTRSSPEWKGIGNKGGYDSAEFKTEISGMPSRCIAIQRYTNHAWTGYKRHMVGMGCAPDDLGLVYAALQQLQAPGD